MTELACRVVAGDLKVSGLQLLEVKIHEVGDGSEYMSHPDSDILHSRRCTHKINVRGVLKYLG